MNKKFMCILLILFSFLLVTGCDKQKNNIINDDESVDNNEVVNTMKIIIDDKEYLVNLENNDTVKALVDLLPMEINMNELNGNEKYFYLKNKLPTNAKNQKYINVGDVMLYGDNCLVIFYKSFDTSYSYTKIGHIDNLPDLGSEDILVKIK